MIVLVPGFLQEPEDLDALAQALEARGLATERRDLVALTHGTDAEGAAARLAATLVEGTILVGYSMGARLSLLAAASAPDLSGLVLLSGSPGLEEPRARKARTALDEERAALLGVDPGRFVRTWGALPMFAPLRKTPAFAPLQERRRLRLTAPRAEAWAHTLRTLSPGGMPSLWPSLSRLDVPTLFVAGALDPVYADIAARAAARAPDATHAVVPAAGHALPLEAPETTADLILAHAGRLLATRPAESPERAKEQPA